MRYCQVITNRVVVKLYKGRGVEVSFAFNEPEKSHR